MWGDSDPDKYKTIDTANGIFTLRFRNSSPLTASSDISFQELRVAQNSGNSFTGTFDLGVGRKVLAGTNMSIGYNGGTADVTLKSGTFGVARQAVGAGGTSLWFGNGSSDGTSRVTVDGEGAVFQTAYSSGSLVGVSHASVFNVINGGLLSGPLILGSTYGSAPFMRECGVLVEGVGSRYQMDSDSTRGLMVGRTGGGAWMVITNGASAVIAANQGIDIATASGTVNPGPCNRFAVVDGSSFSTAGYVYINSSSNSVFEVSGGSTATIAGEFRLGCTKVGNVSPSDNLLKVSGEGTVVTLNGTVRLGWADSVRQKIEITDKAVVNCNAGMLIGRYSNDCVLEVTRGAVLKMADLKELNVGNEWGKGARLVVSAGGIVSNLTATADKIRMSVGKNRSSGSSMLVDNGVIHSPNVSLQTGAEDGATDTSVVIRNGSTCTFNDMFACAKTTGNSFSVEHSTLIGNRLIFGDAGSTDSTFNLVGCDSRLNLGGLTFSSGVAWNFEISGELPQSGTPVVSAYGFSCSNPSTLDITLDEVDFPRGKGGTFTLVHATGMDIADATMSKLTIRAPERVKVVRSANKRDLIVQVSSGLGVMMIIR